MSDLIGLESVSKWVGDAESRMSILSGVSLRLGAGEFVAVMGASGSGKSTLLNIMGLLDTPSDGRVWVQGREVGDLPEDERARMRANLFGFIFQSFHLLPYLTALENVLVPMTYCRRPNPEERAGDLLRQLQLSHRLNAYPATLSGGERQRVAIARALANEPRIILADEPTGALDSRTGLQILEVLSRLNQNGAAIVLVTHDLQIARRAHRIVQIEDGMLR